MSGIFTLFRKPVEQGDSRDPHHNETMCFKHRKLNHDLQAFARFSEAWRSDWGLTGLHSSFLQNACQRANEAMKDAQRKSPDGQVLLATAKSIDMKHVSPKDRATFEDMRDKFYCRPLISFH